MYRKYIAAVQPLSDHVLQVDFVSGSRLLLDMKPYLDAADRIIFGPQEIGPGVRIAFVIQDDAIIELYEEK